MMEFPGNKILTGGTILKMPRLRQVYNRSGNRLYWRWLHMKTRQPPASAIPLPPKRPDWTIHFLLSLWQKMLDSWS
jgi:hypothetical protein